MVGESWYGRFCKMKGLMRRNGRKEVEDELDKWFGLVDFHCLRAKLGEVSHEIYGPSASTRLFLE